MQHINLHGYAYRGSGETRELSNSKKWNKPSVAWLYLVSGKELEMKREARWDNLGLV